MTKKILKIWPFWVKGLKYHDHHLAHFMKEDNVETIFACPNHFLSDYAFSKDDSDHQEYSVFFLEHFVVSNKAIPYNIAAFVKYLKNTNPDVIHIFGLSNFTTIFAMLALFLVRYKGVIIFNDHSDPNERKSTCSAFFYYKIFRLFYQLFIRDKYTIIVPDLATKEELVWRYGIGIINVIRIIPLGYDDKIFCYEESAETSKKPLRLGFAGKILPGKKLEVLLDVVARYSKEELELKIAGITLGKPSQYQSDLMHLFARESLDNVKFLPFRSSPEELAGFYRSIDIAIYPGSISITTFEANGTGCPVLLYNSYAGLEHRVSNGRGLLFSNLEDLVKYINCIIRGDYPGFYDRKAISETSRSYGWTTLKNYYYQEYGWVKMAENCRK